MTKSADTAASEHNISTAPTTGSAPVACDGIAMARIASELGEQLIFSTADIYLARIKKWAGPAYCGRHEDIIKFARSIAVAATDAVFLAATKPREDEVSVGEALDRYRKASSEAFGAAAQIDADVALIREITPLLAAPPANAPVASVAELVLTMEELDALTKKHFSHMHAMYLEGFRRIMRSAIKANAEKRSALLAASMGGDRT